MKIKLFAIIAFFSIISTTIQAEDVYVRVTSLADIDTTSVYIIADSIGTMYAMKKKDSDKGSYSIGYIRSMDGYYTPAIDVKTTQSKYYYPDEFRLVKYGSGYAIQNIEDETYLEYNTLVSKDSLNTTTKLSTKTTWLVKKRTDDGPTGYVLRGETGGKSNNQTVYKYIKHKSGENFIATKETTSTLRYGYLYKKKLRMPDAKYTSLYTYNALDFTNTGLTAYIVSSTEGDSITLKRVTRVPAKTPLVIHGDNGFYTINTLIDTPEDVSENKLNASFDYYTINTTARKNKNYYVLSAKNQVVGFHLCDNDSLISISPRKVFLDLTSSSAKNFMPINNVATSIKRIIYDTDDNYYNLQGQRVINPHTGIYIRKGKKIIIK